MARIAPIDSTAPNDDVTQLEKPPASDMSRSHITHPASTVTPPRIVITFATLRFLTAACSSGPAEGPTSAAEGPMNPTNRNAEPTHRIPDTMWRNRNTSMNGTMATNPGTPSSNGRNACTIGGGPRPRQ